MHVERIWTGFVQIWGSRYQSSIPVCHELYSGRLTRPDYSVRKYLAPLRDDEGFVKTARVAVKVIRTDAEIWRERCAGLWKLPVVVWSFLCMPTNRTPRGLSSADRQQATNNVKALRKNTIQFS